MYLFGGKIHSSSEERDFYNIIHKIDESLRKYGIRLEIAAASIFPAPVEREYRALRSRIKRETVLVKQFLAGLYMRLTNEICRLRQFEIVEDALPYTRQCESALARLYKQTKVDAHKRVL